MLFRWVSCKLSRIQKRNCQASKLDTSKVFKVYDDKRLSLSSHMVVNSSKLCSSLKITNFHISITVQDSSLSELLCVVVVDRCDGQTWPNLEKLNERLVLALIQHVTKRRPNPSAVVVAAWCRGHLRAQIEVGNIGILPQHRADCASWKSPKRRGKGMENSFRTPC